MTEPMVQPGKGKKARQRMQSVLLKKETKDRSKSRISKNKAGYKRRKK